jgi:hypothetical protein
MFNNMTLYAALTGDTQILQSVDVIVLTAVRIGGTRSSESSQIPLK